jgi:hypothetical protein
MFEQLVGTRWRLVQLAIYAEVALAYPGSPSLEWHQTLMARLSQRYAEVEAAYEEDAAFIRRGLEALERTHADNLARLRAHLDTHYKLPSFPR